MLVPYRRFGTSYRSYLQGQSSLGSACSVKFQKSLHLIYVAAEAWNHERLKCVDNHHERVTETKKETSSSKHMSGNGWFFSLNGRLLSAINTARVSLRGGTQNPSVFSSNWQWTQFTNAFFMHVKLFAAAPGPRRKGATVHDKTLPWAHWFKLGTFWKFVLNCDVTNKEKWTVITLWTSVVRLLQQL